MAKKRKPTPQKPKQPQFKVQQGMNLHKEPGKKSTISFYLTEFH